MPPGQREKVAAAQVAEVRRAELQRAVARPAAVQRAQDAAVQREEAVATPPQRRVDPIAALTAAIGKAPLVGYIWTNDVTGYSIKYAYRAALPDGSERIILATDRRLGAHTTAWGPVGAYALSRTTSSR